MLLVLSKGLLKFLLHSCLVLCVLLAIHWLLLFSII